MTSLTNKEMRFITKNYKISKDLVLKDHYLSSSSSTKSQMIGDGDIGHYVITLPQLLATSKLNS